MKDKNTSTLTSLLTCFNTSEILGYMEHSPTLVSHVMKCLSLLQKQSVLLPSARKALTPSAEREVKRQGNVMARLVPGCTAVSFPSQGRMSRSGEVPAQQHLPAQAEPSCGDVCLK